jgi:hypothetical protein
MVLRKRRGVRFEPFPCRQSRFAAFVAFPHYHANCPALVTKYNGAAFTDSSRKFESKEEF